MKLATQEVLNIAEQCGLLTVYEIEDGGCEIFLEGEPGKRLLRDFCAAIIAANEAKAQE